MDNKKTYNLSINKTNDDGTNSNITLSTPYGDEVMALLRLSGVDAPEVSPAPSVQHVEVVADPHVMEPFEPEMAAPDMDVVATEEYANEPEAQTMSQQAVSNYSLKRNLQKMNDVGNYRGDNKLGESLMEKYTAFKKKELSEATQLKLPLGRAPKTEYTPVTLKFKSGAPIGDIHNGGGNMAKHIAKSNRAKYQGGVVGDRTKHYYKVPSTSADAFRDEIKRNVKHIDRVKESQTTSGDADDMNQLNQDIINTLNTYFGGKAWFKGGSYSYLFNVKRPRMAETSDGGKIRIKNFAEAIKDYADSDIWQDIYSDLDYFLDIDVLKNYFRPVKAVRDQESHEIANMRGD